MFNYQFSFLSPWYLLLLALVPLLWWTTLRRLRALGPVRRWVALLLRSAVVVLLVAALAEVQLVRRSDRLTVIYLLDQSLSIPQEQRQQMIAFVNAAIHEHRRQENREDRVGVIVFGREAAIEIPPLDDDLHLPSKIESRFEADYTNIAAAMRLAQASFPEDAAKRIVVVSDGNQNLGDAAQQARQLAAAGIGVDVVPVRYHRRAEVAVERLVLPNDIRRGEPFELKAVVTNSADAGTVVRGRLEFRRLKDDQPLMLNAPEDQHVELPPGKSVFSIRQQIDSPDFYTYEAVFVPDRPEDDAMPQNNRATAFTHVRGKGQVLLVENRQGRGQYDLLAEQLRRQDLEVTVRPSDQCFTSLAELQSFDAVLLADTPREDFSDDQIGMLVRNTQQMGAGLVMLGGPNSFGPGGWQNTEMEEAMPVSFSVKNLKVVPRGALVMIMHASEMAEGNYWQKVIAGAAIQALGSSDLCGVIHWEGNEQWLWLPGLREVGPYRTQMLGRVDRMFPGDMPSFEGPMVMAQRAFASLQDTAAKHMIIISDGDPVDASPAVLGAFKQLKVTISTVAIGAHGQTESDRLRRMAEYTGGKYYRATNPKLLPQIYQREARRVARPLIYENPAGFSPTVHFPHEMLRGIEATLPPIYGFVLTTKKENSLVETALVSPKPADAETNTILASWTYGLGKAVAFTSDASNRWDKDWTHWTNYGKFFAQVVRWSMRPVSDSGKFTVSTEMGDGKVRVVVSALDKNDQFLNFLDLSGTAVGPNLKSAPMKLEQTAPGRYVGEFPAADPGSYFLLISPGAGKAPIRSGVNVPYSEEFRDRDTNDALLEQLAAVTPAGGKPGQFMAALEGQNLQPLLAVNPFRHDLAQASSSQDIWHYLLLVAAWIFFLDIFVRRVHVSFAWAPRLAGRLLAAVTGRQAPAPEPEYLQRLRSRKAEFSERWEQVRASARFEPPPEPGQKPAAEVLDEGLAPPSPPATPKAPTLQTPPEPDADSYTARLLKAKKKAWEKGKDEG